MIALKEVRVVNWHYFRDETIEVGERTLISGNNAMGKSTIVDAIQYALAADLRKARFNLAAGDRRGGRDLAGYVRCKIGSESTEYLRGDTVAHVMLAFARDEGDFTAGVCVEAFSDGRTAERFWIGPGLRVADVEVRGDNKAPLVWRQFRDRLESSGVDFYESKREYLRNLTDRLGVFRRVADYNPYLESFTRSVSFTPLVSVDRFVCDYILEERPLSVKTMKDNLECYKEAERQANGTIRKIAVLTEVRALAEEYRRLQASLAKQDYLKVLIDKMRASEKAESNERETKDSSEREERLSFSINENAREQDGLASTLREVTVALARDDAHSLYVRIKDEISSLERDKAVAMGEAERCALIVSQCGSLIEGSLIDAFGAATPESKTPDMRELIARYADTLDSARSETEGRRHDAARELAETEHSLRECASELMDLERGIQKYPNSSMALVRALKERGIESWILADLAEISDPDWANAVEGWLNTLRFAVIVEGSSFQAALESYDSLPKGIGGVALPNIAKLKVRAEQIQKGSLATLVSSDNPWAAIYLNAILGDVMTADIATLKNYGKAITRECMSYSNHTATRVKEEVWKDHWLGKRAREQRLKHLRAELARLEEDKRIRSGACDDLAERLRVLGQGIRSLADARPIANAAERAAKLGARIAELSKDLSHIDISAFAALEAKRDELTRLISEIGKKRDELTSERARIHARIEHLDRETKELQAALLERTREFDFFCAERASELTSFEEYASERLKRSSLSEIAAEYGPARKGIETRSEKALAQYRRKVGEFASQFNAFVSVEIADYPALCEILERLERSELPLYRDRITAARQDAEREFREHFIAKLNEYIIEARESFREINETLKGLAFGNDHYGFTLEERADRRGQIKIVQKAAEITSFDGGLFEQIVDPEERKATEALFENIIHADLDSAEMRSICDYRTYFAYDIRIRDAKAIDPATGKPVELSLSRVLREKSGGESQTPYYVAIAASFYRFFKDKPESTVRFVLFDEAFDKLDDERIRKVIEFYSSMGIQLMMAVPPGKIEAIAPLMDRVHIVSRVGQDARIREFRAIAEDVE